MEWTDFLLFLSAGYLIYYGIIVGLDLLKSGRGAVILAEEDILEFTEENETTIIEDREESNLEETLSKAVGPELEELPSQEEDPESLPLYGENVNVSTGGVSSIIDLFRLAQDETIEFKKNLVY